MRPLRRRWLKHSLGLVSAGAMSPSMHATPNTTPHSGAVCLALIGDLPYSAAARLRAQQLFAELNRWPLDLVIHVGDIQGSDEPCTDALLADRAELFTHSHHPLLLLAGDNEWTDCHRPKAGGRAPLQRLAALRAQFWQRPGPLGTLDPARPAIALRRQAGQPENIQWQTGSVYGVGLHVVGSDNGLKHLSGRATTWTQRQHANDAWLNDALTRAQANQARALLIAFHGDPDFATPFPSPGYRAHLAALRAAAERFKGPILIMHGDTHQFRVDQPLRDTRGQRYAHVTRVECFGYPFDHAWVHICWHPAQPTQWTITAQPLASLDRL